MAPLMAVLFLLLSQYAAVSSADLNDVTGAFSLCPADRNENWTYRGDNGPYYWGDTYPMCNGNSQSPIKINERDAVQDGNLAKLAMVNYDIPISNATIENNGHTIQLAPRDDVERSIVVEDSTYTLQQLHFHWGGIFQKGSEHVLNGRRYTMEMHLVHMNTNDEIAVVGVLFDETLRTNNALQSIVDALPELRYKDTETVLATPLNLNNLVPENPASYYRYSGSLTTPDCAEGVTWSVLTETVSVGFSQMSEFRRLYSATREEAIFTCTLSNNFRPIQALNGRQVLLSQ